MTSANETSSDAPTSGLLALPAELRLDIYDFLWPPISPIQANPTKSLDEVSSTNILTKGALLYTCRQLRTETAPIFYSRNTFTGNLSFLDTQPFITWLYTIGPDNVKLMPKILIQWRIPQHYNQHLQDLAYRARLFEQAVLSNDKLELAKTSRDLAREESILPPGHLTRAFDAVEIISQSAWPYKLRDLLHVPGIDGFKVQGSEEYGLRWRHQEEFEEIYRETKLMCLMMQHQLEGGRINEIENSFVGRFGGYEWLSIE